MTGRVIRVAGSVLVGLLWLLGLGLIVATFPLNSLAFLLSLGLTLICAVAAYRIDRPS